MDRHHLHAFSAIAVALLGALLFLIFKTPHELGSRDVHRSNASELVVNRRGSLPEQNGPAATSDAPHVLVGDTGPTRETAHAVGTVSEGVEEERGGEGSGGGEVAGNNSQLSQIERMMLPWRVAELEKSWATLEDINERPGQRLNAAHKILSHSIALFMEGNGTAEDLPRVKSIRPLRLPLQFTMDGRMYCFNQGDYPLWDEWKKLVSAGSAGPPSEYFIAGVSGLARDLVSTLKGH